MPTSNDQSTTDRANLSRREAFRKLGAGGAAAAAMATLPTGTAEAGAALIELAATPAPACHPLLCFPDEYRAEEESREQREIERTLDRAALGLDRNACCGILGAP